MSVWNRGPEAKVKWLVFFAILCIIPFVFLGPLLSWTVEASKKRMDQRYTDICVARLRKVGQGMAQYAADNDGMLPSAERWMDATWKYVMKDDPSQITESPFQCPLVSKARTGEFGFAMGIELSGAKLDGSTGDLVFDARDHGRNARGTSADIEYRHAGERANVLSSELTVRSAQDRAK